jgi:hypothetical protein
MGLKNRALDLNYLEEDTGVNTRINIFKYRRTRPNEKIKSEKMCFITFPLPVNMPNDTYDMSIQDIDLGLIGNLGGADVSSMQNADVNKITDTISDTLKNFYNNPDQLAKLGMIGLATAPGISDILSRKTGLGISLAEAAQLEAGIVRNPHTALLFQNVRLRTFTFTWQLSPRSESQSKTLDNIIKVIKTAMHPSLNFKGFALDYPDLFTVNFNNNKEGIVNVDASFLQDFSINPTPNGHAYYKNGYPVDMLLSMTFKEVAIKTSEDYDSGVNYRGNTGFASPKVRD